jgi:hypothetical protein
VGVFILLLSLFCEAPHCAGWSADWHVLPKSIRSKTVILR